jgi:hypothetical protein
VLTSAIIFIVIDALFDPEILQGTSYPAGKVFEQLSLNRGNEQLKKIETIQGGILGANIGE